MCFVYLLRKEQKNLDFHLPTRKGWIEQIFPTVLFQIQFLESRNPLKIKLNKNLDFQFSHWQFQTKTFLNIISKPKTNLSHAVDFFLFSLIPLNTIIPQFWYPSLTFQVASCMHFRPKMSYAMGLYVRLSVCLSVRPLLQHLQKHMSEWNKETS
jgi:hypothetical protein